MAAAPPFENHAIDTSSPKRLAFDPASNQQQPRLKSKFAPTQPHPSRQPSTSTPLRPLLGSTTGRPSASAGFPPIARQPSSRSLQALRTPARVQPGPLSPIQISSTGKVSKVGGGNVSVDSIEYPEADEDDTATGRHQAKQAKQARLGNQLSGYQKKTPMGKAKVRAFSRLLILVRL